MAEVIMKDDIHNTDDEIPNEEEIIQSHGNLNQQMVIGRCWIKFIKFIHNYSFILLGKIFVRWKNFITFIISIMYHHSKWIKRYSWW